MTIHPDLVARLLIASGLCVLKVNISGFIFSANLLTQSVFFWVDYNAIDPFITMAPFDVLTNYTYENSFDTLFSSSPKVCSFFISFSLELYLNIILFIIIKGICTHRRKKTARAFEKFR